MRGNNHYISMPNPWQGVHRLGQGLCVSGEWSDEQGDRGGGMLTVVAQAGTDLADARSVQQTDRRLAQQRHDRCPCP